MFIDDESWNALLDDMEDLRDRLSVYESTGDTVPFAQVIADLGLTEKLQGVVDMTDKTDFAKFLAEEAEAVEAAERDGVSGSLIGCTVTRRGRTFRVERSEPEYVGLATDFPSLSWLAATEDDALIGIMRLVRDIDDGRA